MKDFPHLIQYTFIYAKNYLLETLAMWFPKIVPRPLYVGLSVGTLCNFRCKQCDFWRLETDSKNYLKTNQIKRIFKQLKDWLGPFKLTLTGAEPFIRKDILDIISFAAKNGIYTVITTNGWLIDEKMAKQIVESGLDVINISLDGAKPSTHDQLRGKKKAFGKAISALRNLKRARGKRKFPAVYINTVIMDQNLKELVDLGKLAKKEKIDSIRYQALESKQLFGDEKYNPEWFKNNPLWPKDAEKVELIISNLIKLKVKNYPIKNTINELKDLKSYYKNPITIAKKYKFCFTGVRNFAIDEYGNVKLCFGMKPVGNVLKQKPEEIWYGEKTNKLRKQIRSCQRYCRILPCNKREEKRQLVKALFMKLFR